MRVLVVGVLVATLWGAGVAHARPGDLLDARPLTAQLLPGVALGGKAWKVTYRSAGERVVTGTVLVPDRYDGGPLIGYAIGSQGLADRCAPSAQLAAGTEYEAALIRAVLDRGWAVALTDYPGLGTPGDHTYVVNRLNGRAVLDAMRAARRLPAVGRHQPLALFGYSEGGGASGAAAEEQPAYAPDLPLRGAVVGGVVADLPRTGASLEGGPFAFLLAYTAIGFDAAYPELDLDAALNARGRATVAALRRSCLFEAIPSAPFARSTDLLTEDLLHRPDWVARLREHSLGGKAPRTPVLLSHARYDEVLPYDAAYDLAKRWCGRGVDVEFRTLEGGEHVLGAVQHSPQALDWLADRFAGTPAAGC